MRKSLFIALCGIFFSAKAHAACDCSKEPALENIEVEFIGMVADAERRQHEGWTYPGIVFEVQKILQMPEHLHGISEEKYGMRVTKQVFSGKRAVVDTDVKNTDCRMNFKRDSIYRVRAVRIPFGTPGERLPEGEEWPGLVKEGVVFERWWTSRCYTQLIP